MIRDPSDGSVRHHPKPLENKPYIDEKPVLDIATSGLPITKADYLARLEESRKWLREFVQKNSTDVPLPDYRGLDKPT